MIQHRDEDINHMFQVKCTAPFQLSSTKFALNNAIFQESEGVINSFNTKSQNIKS